MTGPELTLQKKIIRKVKSSKIPGLVHFQLQLRGRRGWPDDMFAANGKVVFVECKRESGGKVSPQQWEIMELLHGANITVYIGDSIDVAELVINDLK